MGRLNLKSSKSVYLKHPGLYLATIFGNSSGIINTLVILTKIVCLVPTQNT